MSSSLSHYQQIVSQLPGYEPRPVQETMVGAVSDALQRGVTRCIEAGTGSGKSFGYLIPAIEALDFHVRPIVISTGTIALQEQLINKDIPFILQAAGKPKLNIKLVKGRRNYLCIQKMTEFEKTLRKNAPEKLYITMLKTSLADGWDGDRAVLDVEIPPDIWAEVQSDSEDCLGNRCSYFLENPYRQAREDLEKADILVTNHALYFQDVVSGQALLPPHEAVIFDEAHQLRSYALNAFTASIGKFATRKILRKIDRRLQSIPDIYQNEILETESHVMSWLFDHGKTTFKLYPDSRFFELVDHQVMILSELRAWLSGLEVKQLSIETLGDTERMQTQREKLLQQLDGLTGRWAYFAEASTMDRVNWVEVKNDRLYYEFRSTPLNIADQLKESLWNKRHAILTSATLSVDNNLKNLRKELGIPMEDAQTDLVLPSPFDYKRQCNLYLPSGLPEPNDPMYTPACVEEIVKILETTEGRAFVLFTSIQAMDKVSAAVIPQVVFPCKVQGDMPKHKLIEWFKTTKNSVLFATSTFWEGIDIPGEALSCVIIDKIPFTNPEDPVQSAMVDRLKLLNEDWFNGYVLPEAIIRLKQGFGRLIRTKDDTGVVAILDPRLKTKGYGKRVLRSLPPAKQTQSLQSQILEEAIQF